MLHRTLAASAAAALLAAAVVVPNTGLGIFSTVQDDVLSQADKAFAEKTYSAALDLYRTAAKDPNFAASHDRAAVRIGECLARLNRPDEALDSLAAYASEKAGTRGERLARIERGVVALTMPHYYYEKDGKRSRGEWVQGGTYVWTENDDLLFGTADLERARTLGLMHKAEGGAAWTDDDAKAHVRALLELGSGLEELFVRRIPVPDDRVDPSDAGYGAHRKWLDRMFAAFDEAVATQASRKDVAGEALALYLKGAAARRVLGTHRVVARGFEIHEQETETFKPLPKERDPVAIAELARDKAKGIPTEDSFVFALAHVREEFAFYNEALKAFRELKDGFPKSIFQGDANAAIERLTFPRLSLEPRRSIAPKATASMRATGRNVSQVAIEIHKAEGKRTWLDESFLREGERRLGEIDDLVAETKWRPREATRVAAFTVHSGDDGSRRPLDFAFDLPPLDVGTYFVRATADGVDVIALLVVADLAVVAKADATTTLAFVVDATTGLPVEGATVVFRERRRTRGFFGGWTWKETHERATTDKDGVATRVRPEVPENCTVEVLAVHGERVAIAPETWASSERKSARAPSIYLVTNRPVYRPGDPVRVAAIATRDDDDARTPLAAEIFGVEVRDPQNREIYKREHKTDADGAFEFDLKLGEEPALGSYSVLVRDGRRVLRRSAFRVEEYLKPEFEVRVEGPKEQLRLGDPGKATIVAEYYFGGGVAGGEVSWSILRDAWRPTFRRDEPWRAFYGFSTEPHGPASPTYGRELVASGTTTLNSDGRAEIAFETAKWKDVEGDGSTFVVRAEVVDSSRRTISGEGRVVVSKFGLSFDLRPKKSFYVVGENVEIELQSVVPSGAPAAVKGVFKTAKVKPAVLDPEGRIRVPEQRTELDAVDGEADEKGLGVFRTTFDEPGYYAVRFEARDRFENLCFGEVRFWASGPNFRADGFASKNFELTPERRTYVAGETARILLLADIPDAAVFYSVESDRTMRKTGVVRLTGKTALLEVPIEASFAPNVFVHVVAVRGGEFFEERLELFVPPVEKFATTTLAFSKSDYRPGEIGDLVVTTTNAAGAPIPSRAVVTVLDASLFYIQNDETPDFRRFLYGTRRYANVSRVASSAFTYGVRMLDDVKFGDYETYGSPPVWWLRPGVATALLANAAITSDEFLGWSDGSWGGGVKKRGRGGFLRGLAADAESAAPSAAPMERPRSAIESAMPESSGEERLGDAAFMGVAKDDYVGGVRGGVLFDDAAAPDVALRTDFRDEAFWSTTVATDASGKTTVRVPFPESTTLWRAKAWTWTSDVRVGEGTADVRTTKKMVARLRAPRFFVEGDVVTVTASINNLGDAPIRANVSLDAGDGGLLAIDERDVRTVDAPAKGVGRVDWRVRVLRAGTATLALKAWSGDETDGLKFDVPVYEWGAEKRLFEGAVLEGSATSTLAFEIPEERRAETAKIRVSVAPSIALTLVDALPYLIEYPYGCTEQTTSRFIPAVVVARALREAGTTLDEVAKKRADSARATLQGAGREKRAHAYQLDDVVRAGLARLRALQRHDGGFGWFKEDDSNVYMTSYVLQGLAIARDADVSVDDGLISGCVAFLKRALPDERRLETAAFGAFALASAGAPLPEVAEKIFKARDGLSLYGKALLASALSRGGRAADAALIVKAFDDHARVDESNGTVHFGSNRGGWWFWWNSRVETNAAILHALLDVDPKTAHAAPLAKWLALNRRGNRWTNTRDTAHAIFALLRYARATGELDPDMEVRVRMGDGAEKTLKIDRSNLFTFDGTFEIEGDAVKSGRAPIVVTTSGKGRCYVAAEASFFTKEAEIASAGRELFVEREYVRVRKETKEETVDGRVVAREIEVFEPLARGAVLQSGDVVEVRLKIDAKNDYEHLLFEDMKPAGFEPVEVKSGGKYEKGVCSNVEYRDEKTALFATWLEQGTHALTYRLRAELPGELRAAPARGEAMYAPDVAGTSASFRFEVRDKVETR
jgi:alpha-2-macroglobulin